MKQKDYKEARIIRTGYELSKAQIDNLTPEEKSARDKEMLLSREEIKRMNDYENE